MMFSIMEDPIYLLFILNCWLLMDFLGVISLSKPMNQSRHWKININFKEFINKKHRFISFVIELIGIIFLIIFFGFPWYYHHYFGFGGDLIRNFFIIESNLGDILLSFIYHAYLIGLIILVIKISAKEKTNVAISLELIELILITLSIEFIASIHFYGCDDIFLIPETYCIDSGYSIGFFLFVIGLITLFLNGLQMSIYLRLKRRKINLFTSKR